MAAILREWPKIKAFYRERPVVAIVSSIIAGWLGVTVSKNTPPYPAALSTSPADENKDLKSIEESFYKERAGYVEKKKELLCQLKALEMEKRERGAGAIGYAGNDAGK